MSYNIIIVINNHNTVFPFDLHGDFGLPTTHFTLQYIENMPAFGPYTIDLCLSFYLRIDPHGAHSGDKLNALQHIWVFETYGLPTTSLSITP